jgi:UDP-N-acetylglucosamine--N-acetylmuramyl-(pentapeptide) pyrophosphoryl-undecaprenol N-acetylglucosamine transferase
MIERVIIAGGGTGGHLFPGISVLEELRRREPGLAALFVGTARGIETRVVPAMHEQLECLDVRPIKGRSPTELVKSLWALPEAGLHAARLIRRFAPRLVLGVGGYAAGPMVATAFALGVPTALLEQNAHVGLTNKLLSHCVKRAYLSFEETRGEFQSESVRVVGNPVRRDFVNVGKMARVDPAGFEMRARKILVVGGSQGARALNQLVPQALSRAGLAERGIEIVHQTGQAMCDEVAASYAALGVHATVTPFIEDMARAYAGAALVIGRAGATSLAEICAVGRPSILIPFPAAADDHQWHNAHALAQRGAAVAIRESELTAEGLAGTVRDVLADPARRRAMADAARALGRPDAAAAIVDDLLAWLAPGSGQDSDGEGEDGDVFKGDTEGGSLAHALYKPVQLDGPARRGSARRRSRPHSAAWTQPDRYYGTRAVGALE